MTGCLSAPFKLLLFLALVAALALGWLYRDRLGDVAADFRRRVTGADVVESAAGLPGPEALQRARAKIARLDRADSVVLSAAETASMLYDGFAPYARGTLDSMQVTLGDGDISVTSLVRTSRLPSGLLGPFGAAMREREPITAQGPIRVVAAGQGAWDVRRISFRDIPLPSAAVPQILDRALGDSSRALPFALPRSARDVRVRPSGVTLYARPQ